MGESSRALLTLTTWLKDDNKLFESVYPEMMSNTSDLATLTQVLHMEAHTQGTRDSVQKHIPVSSSATDNDLVLGRLLRLAVIQVCGELFSGFFLKILRKIFFRTQN